MADHVGPITRLPRLTILLFVGAIVGQSGFGLLPEEAHGWFEPISVVALTMVAVLLGADLTSENLAKHGRAIFTISLAVVVGTTLIVWAGMPALGIEPGLALLLGAIAIVTVPPAIADVILQSGIKNRFSGDRRHRRRLLPDRVQCLPGIRPSIRAMDRPNRKRNSRSWRRGFARRDYRLSSGLFDRSPETQ